jgi:hypothetical protein
LDIPTQIKNTLTKPVQIINAMADKGVGSLGITLQSGTTDSPDLKDLEDLTLVDRTLPNARKAIEIDPTTWSSILSLVIVSTKDKITITGDEDANNKAVKHIQRKVREWNLDQQKITTTYKGLVDGRCFIENYIQNGKPTINEINHLAFDEDNYNFLEVRDPYTNELYGYKQTAKIYPVPGDWENQSFSALQNRSATIKETTFTRKNGYLPVFMPVFFQGDGNSEGLVFKVLDDVYCLKTLKNMMPDAAKISSSTVGVQVGNKDFPFKPYDNSDDTNTKISKAESRMKSIGENFTDRFKKQIILYDGGITPSMIGNGTLPDFSKHIDIFKQEIRSSLLTPDSRFESASSNRAVSQEQLSGSMGQVTVVDYIRNNFISYYYEKYIFDLELALAGYSEDLGKIHIQFGEKETEDEDLLSQIADRILKYRPDLFDTVANLYYPRLAPELNKVDNEVQTSLDQFTKPEMTDEKITLNYINSMKERLTEDGLLI